MSAERIKQQEDARFARIFPPQMFSEYTNNPNEQLDLFKTLDRFGFKVKIDQNTRNLVKTELAASELGLDIHFIHFQDATKIYSSEVKTVILAGFTSWTNIADLMENEARKSLSKLFQS